MTYTKILSHINMIKYLLLSHTHITYYLALFTTCYMLPFVHMINCKKNMFSYINISLHKNMINVYFFHLITNYEEPYNAIIFKMVQFHHLLLWVLLKFHKPPNLTTHLMVCLLKKVKGKTSYH
jgi:hypothetical protein